MQSVVGMQKVFKNKNKIRVLMVQQINRAYRVPLLKKLNEHPDIELSMIYGTNLPVQPGDIGISVSNEHLPFRSIPAKISGIRWKDREILWFGKANKLIKQEYFDVVITDYYTRLLSTWRMQSIQRKRNAATILWSIGFHQYPTPMIDKLRKLMVARSDALLLYSESAKQKYINMGVSAEKCFVTQNTVDIEGIDAGIASVTEEKISLCREKIQLTDGPVLMHVGRLAPNKRLDILLHVLSLLKKNWPTIKLVLIGEGPELSKLNNLAADLSISDSVHLLGAITDHRSLAPWMHLCDLVVAPAQIGLMAPMSLVYGKPLVISDKEELHGPEAQAFLPGKTGLIYRFGELDDLYQAIDNLLKFPDKRKEFGSFGNSYVRKIMGPEIMFTAFIDAIYYADRNNKSRV